MRVEPPSRSPSRTVQLQLAASSTTVEPLSLSLSRVRARAFFSAGQGRESTALEGSDRRLEPAGTPPSVHITDTRLRPHYSPTSNEPVCASRGRGCRVARRWCGSRGGRCRAGAARTDTGGRSVEAARFGPCGEQHGARKASKAPPRITSYSVDELDQMEVRARRQLGRVVTEPERKLVVVMFLRTARLHKVRMAKERRQKRTSIHPVLEVSKLMGEEAKLPKLTKPPPLR